MATAADIASLARRMKTAQDTVAQIAPFSATPPGLDLDAAYAVADAVHQARLRDGARAVGRKIGFTNPALWSVYGVHQPIWGWMYERSVAQARAQCGQCSLARFAEAKIEPEIVLHFRSAPPAGDDPAAILACVDWVAHGFEIVQSHFAGWQFQAADTVADGGLHGCLLVGAPLSVERLGSDPLAALREFSLALYCDGQRRDAGQGSNVLGSPLAAIAHLVALLAQQPAATPIQAGEIITTGTLTAAWTIAAGQSWHTTLDGIALPGLRLDVVA